ncbi:MAG: hypothetical protein WDM92_02355 [Caulobacteraceae bacterium]
MLFGFLLSILHPPQVVMRTQGGPPHIAQVPAAAPYLIGGLAIMVTATLVGVFYCLGALHNERRDRSILFWKSLPVSDLTAVLAKAAIPMAVLPAVTIVVTLIAQLLMLIMGSAAHAVRGRGRRPSVVAGSPAPCRRPVRLRRDHPDPVVRAGVGLAAAGLGLGQADDLPVGRRPAPGAVRLRAAGVQHRLRLEAAQLSPHGQRGGSPSPARPRTCRAFSCRRPTWRSSCRRRGCGPGSSRPCHARRRGVAAPPARTDLTGRLRGTRGPQVL